MSKFNDVRPIVLGIAKNDNKILVEEGFDFVSGKHYYRCLGGGIEFLEKSYDAIKREFKEEINIDISVNKLLGICENIFTYEGKNAHELILFYSVSIPKENYQDKYIVTEEKEKSLATWIDIDEFKNRKKIIYPTQTIQYL